MNGQADSGFDVVADTGAASGWTDNAPAPDTGGGAWNNSAPTEDW